MAFLGKFEGNAVAGRRDLFDLFTRAGVGLAAMNLLAQCGPRPVASPDGGVADAGVTPPDFALESSPPLSCPYPFDMDAVSDGFVGACTGPNALLQISLTAKGKPVSPYSTFLDLAANQSQPLNGLTFRAPKQGILVGASGVLEFGPAIPNGIRLALFPQGFHEGGGAWYVGSRLFIATANLKPDLTYNPGTVLACDLDAAGSMNLDANEKIVNFNSITTTDFNPTGMTLLPSGELLVLNSGDFTANPKSSLDRINPSGLQVVRNIPLGNFTAQVGSELATSDDGNTAFIGTASVLTPKPVWAGTFAVANLVSGAVETIVFDGFRFIQTPQILGGRVYVGDFNTGQVVVWDPAKKKIVKTLQVTPPSQNPNMPEEAAGLGPAGVSGDSVYWLHTKGLVRIIPPAA